MKIGAQYIPSLQHKISCISSFEVWYFRKRFCLKCVLSNVFFVLCIEQNKWIYLDFFFRNLNPYFIFNKTIKFSIFLRYSKQKLTSIRFDFLNLKTIITTIKNCESELIFYLKLPYPAKIINRISDSIFRCSKNFRSWIFSVNWNKKVLCLHFCYINARKNFKLATLFSTMLSYGMSISFYVINSKLLNGKT